MTITVYPAQNAETHLEIPTYDGSGQCVHPSVLYNANGWNGYKYWMAMTPYPNTNDDYENPSIVVSNDGDTWVVPNGLTNPVIPFPGGALFGSDPDIVWSENGNSIYLYYKETSYRVYEKIYVVASTDGVTWSQPELVFEYLGTGLRLSPACLYDNSAWKIWCVQEDSTLIELTCDTFNGTFTKSNDCVLTNPPADKRLWHIDINKYGDQYHGFLNYCNVGTSGAGGVLYFAQSGDGTNWTVESAPTLSGSVSGWDKGVYRASGIAFSGEYDLFYSGESSGNAVGSWFTGRTSMEFIDNKKILLKKSGQT